MHIETQIRRFLVEDYYRENWEDFVDHQKMGDCQGIVHFIKLEFPQVTKVFGEIQNDNGRWMTHHWIEYKGKIYEFSKGSLKNYIDFMDLYETYPESNYRRIKRKHKKVKRPS